MRQVFTSARLENVEAVAELLRAEGIEVRITNDRSYRGNRRSNFSYREQGASSPQPAVWIVNADDQPRGRQLLRDAGLLESSRAGESSYLPLSVLEGDKKASKAGTSSRAMRIKLGLLALIVVVIWLMVSTVRKPASTTVRPAKPAPVVVANPAPAIVPQSIDELQTYRAAVPTALAKMLVEGAIEAESPAQACIAIDGKDPSAQFMQGLKPAAKTALSSASQCPGETALGVDVHGYMTDGSGRGSVRLKLGNGAQVIDVERAGERWRVLRVR
ncbi:MAG: hypothetical protein EOP93_07670 [Lysobacteraceae bacterium]|nr:MAG: hypothetical protein EOP93_07670 [Xanthomonadaceae bacterium]